MMRLSAVCAVLVLGSLSSCVQFSSPMIGLAISSSEVALTRDVEVTLYVNGKQQPVFTMLASKYNNTIFSVAPETSVCITAHYVGESSSNSARGTVALVGQALPQLIGVYDSSGRPNFSSVFLTPVDRCP
jgi:hypothetical protein